MTTRDPQYWIDILHTDDRKGVQELYDRFLPGIVKLVTQNSGSREEALDIFQEAIIVVYKKIKKQNLTLTASFQTYLYAVSRNLWLKRLEKKGKMMVTSAPPSGLKDDNDFDNIIQEEERYRLFRSKFNELSESCRQVLTLFFQKTSMADIVKILGFSSIAYAKKRKFQCKEQLVSLVRNDSNFINLRHG